MEDITEATIDSAWHPISQITPEAARDGIASIGETQAALLDFFMPCSDALQPEAKSCAVFLFYAVYRVFVSAYGEPDKIGDDELEALYDMNESQLGDLETLDRDAIAGGVKEGAFVQPHVVDFVAALLYGEVGAEDAEIGDNYEPYDRGMIFLLIKTVIDAIDATLYNEDKEA